MSEKTLKTETKNLAAAIKAALEVDHQTGTISEKEKGSVYFENLSDGLTKEIIEQVDNYNTTFAAAGTYAIGELAVEAFQKNQALKQATGEIAMGTTILNVDVDREKTYTNHLSGDGAEVTKYGVSKIGYETRAGKNKGEMKIARDMINELAMSQLTKK